MRRHRVSFYRCIQVMGLADIRLDDDSTLIQLWSHAHVHRRAQIKLLPSAYRVAATCITRVFFPFSITSMSTRSRRIRRIDSRMSQWARITEKNWLGPTRQVLMSFPNVVFDITMSDQWKSDYFTDLTNVGTGNALEFHQQPPSNNQEESI